MVLVINKDHLFNLCLGGGLQSNTKDELLSLFGLLHFAPLNGISDISIFGDSKIIMGWLNGSTNLQVLLLKHWIHKVQDKILDIDPLNAHDFLPENLDRWCKNSSFGRVDTSFLQLFILITISLKMM